MKHQIYVSMKNGKMGNIPSVSLPPGKTCAKNVKCLSDCYAFKMQDYRPPVKKSWETNLAILETNPESFFNQIDAYFACYSPRFFRIHVAGDFVNLAYLRSWIATAQRHPDTKFLAFTKRTDILHHIPLENIPRNLSLVVSAWPGRSISNAVRLSYPVAWVQDGTETRIPDNALECPHGCDTCGLCFHLRQLKRDVWFHKTK